MLKIGWFSAKLFFKGKLIRDPLYFTKQILIATAISSLLLILLAFTQLPLLLPVAISSILTGVAVPFLLKDFKTQ
ncbi:hypothetical protein NIES4101_61330 [Calothrix sp. NIES-4101]|uniref:hypothetical protein n=1 Tax=Calothrix sp. UHCC 0171 TaxID=3110245 RepID=UPI000B5DF982|nr:hypothetical protein [Calothrix sp. UHCC 0171]MEA5571954.1 hypothetical protein [Calothrix sp. UHCC 0171]BAZ40172.1 hypothetical protein NIES4101_61330 [Calothrix sp. NIES-4101]